MGAQVIPITIKLDAAWADYLDRKAKAEASGELTDGIEAGRAWRRWLDLFVTEDQRKIMGAGR